MALWEGQAILLSVNKKKIYIRFGLVILWMIVIFMFSMQNGDQSSGTSGQLLARIGEWIGIDLIHLPIMDTLQFIIRKSAHMFSYFVLGILSYRAVVLLQPLKPYRYAALITVIYACSDELHQLFVPGRSGQIQDVFIDSLGMLIGFAIIYIIKRIKNKRMNHN